GQTTSGAGAPSEGLGTSESFSKLTQGGGEETETEATQTTPTATTASGTSTSTVLLFGGLVAAAVLLGIAFFILRDARRVAPVSDAWLADASRTSAARMRKRRAKAKAAKRQRKRNR
ncbi:MAG: hypothetical protein ACRDK2_09780, partial [Solirubrobacteraceae bacterium]